MMGEPLTFIHLSDIHFQVYRNGQLDLDKDLRNELMLDVARVMESARLNIDGLLVSGDIAYHGSQTEYATSSDWLNLLCDQVGCPQEIVWVVPGNHDVDRSVARNSKTIKTIHKELQTCEPDYVDAHLDEWMNDSNGMESLFKPLDSYNEFAARYRCSTTPSSITWKDDLTLNDGSKLRLYGINSALASGTEDNEKGKLVVGTAQAGNLLRTEGVTYLSLCHHPSDWLLDGKLVTDYLNARAAIQLYGHEHRQRITTIGDETLMIGAGALQPSRGDDEWSPTYNLIQVSVNEDGADRNLLVSIWPRVWNNLRKMFNAELDEGDSERWQYKLKPTNLADE